MRPITFKCRATLDLPPERIAARILDLDQWPRFQGYGPIPGIERAEFERRTDAVVGTRIRVRNRDGSTHVEEIVAWNPSARLQLRMADFSPPLSKLASEFLETWDLRREGDVTHVTRTFEMTPRSFAARPALWMISLLLRAAVNRHFRILEVVSDES